MLTVGKAPEKLVTCHNNICFNQEKFRQQQKKNLGLFSKYKTALEEWPKYQEQFTKTSSF